MHDLSYGKCPTEVDLLRLYMKALRNRSVASHQLNMDSSRSHALFTVYVDSMVCRHQWISTCDFYADVMHTHMKRRIYIYT